MPNFLKQRKFLFLVIAVLACFAIFEAVLIQQGTKGIFSFLHLSNKANLTLEEATNQAVQFINTNFMKGATKASLVGKPFEKEGLYAFTLKVGSQSFVSYVTKDGKLLFPQAFDVSKMENQTQANANTNNKTPKKVSCKSVKKEVQPKLQAFVVSYCPFGLQMQRVLTTIVDKIPSLAKEVEIRYMGSVANGKITSMHGQKEAQENLRQICLREEQPNSFFPYLTCHIRKDDVDGCLKSSKVDEKKLQGCMQSSSRGLAYAKKDFALQDKYHVTGSPTLFLNGERMSESDFGGRTAQAVKSLICCGFEDKPAVCSKTLESYQVPTGFSSTYTGDNKPAQGADGSGTNGGGCNTP